MLHEGYTLPAWDTALRWERVEPAESAVFVVEVLARAFEMDVLGLFGRVTGLCFEGLGAGEGEDGV